MRAFGAVARKVTGSVSGPGNGARGGALSGAPLAGKLTALSLTAIAWGFVNFGLLLWLPADLVAKGYSVGVASKLLAESALISFPTVFLATFLYSRWSTKWALAAMIAATLGGLAGVLAFEAHGLASPVLPVALLIVGSNGMIAILLPYTAESFPLQVRGRATGWVAACSKGGGVIAQALSITALVPALGIAAILVMVPSGVALLLIARFGRETRGADLRALEADGGEESAAQVIARRA